MGAPRHAITFRIVTCGEDLGFGFAVEEGNRNAELEAKPQADGKKPVRGLQAVQHQVVGNCELRVSLATTETPYKRSTYAKLTVGSPASTE